MDAQELVWQVCRQQSGTARVRITSVARVTGDIATVRATDVRTGVQGQFRINLRTGREYPYSADAWVVAG